MSSRAAWMSTAVAARLADRLPTSTVAESIAAFACATLTLDILAMSAYGLGGAALAARMTEPRFARGFAVVVGLLLLTAAVLMARKAGGA